MRWQPISEMTEALRYSKTFFLYGPEIIDLDFNPEGIVEGHWQDDPEKEEGGCYIGAVWDNCQDVFNTVEVIPTHFMIKQAPDSKDVSSET